MAVALVKQLALVVIYPPFQGHDEVAHLGYLRTLAADGRLPTFADELPAELEPYSRYTLDWPAVYTANHPPLYYALAWPVFRLADDDALSQLYLARLVAVPLFLLTIWLTWLIATTLVPDDDFVPLAATAVVAFQPQLSFEGAIVNNDILAVALGALILFLLLRAIIVGFTARLALAIGLAIGLGLLSKATLTALLPVVAGVAIWLRWPRPWARVRDGDWQRGTLIRAAAIVAPVLALALPWYFYLRRTYGDFTAFEATRELQSGWNRPAGTFTELLFSGSFHEERVHETWGYFGWRLLPLGSWELRFVYAALALCVAGAIVGLARWLRGTRLHDALGSRRAGGVATLAIACAVMYGAMVYFGTMFLLTQARYFFPVLPAMAVLAMMGLGSLIPDRARSQMAAVVVAGAAVFQALVLTRLVLPYAAL
jgi:4-amino-4-deoxy-L-arabinose transferase-like glycosyltransferase